MANIAKDCKSTIIPGMRYRNAPEMIEWLCKAFGFEKKAVYSDDQGIVMHAELTFGNGMIMIGSVTNGTPSAQYMMQPDEAGGRQTQSSYLIVSDCDSIYTTAKANGAQIVFELEDKGYGGKGFTCRDPEEHVWSFGTYDPWAS